MGNIFKICEARRNSPLLEAKQAESLYSKVTNLSIWYCVFYKTDVSVFYHWDRGLPDAFRKNTGRFEMSTVPDLSCVVFRKRYSKNRETIRLLSHN